jgi:phenylalanyl-tRNA synthetase alpha chain
MSKYIDKISLAIETARKKLASAPGAAELESVRASLVGRNGVFTALGKELASLSAEEKPNAGKVLNAAKKEISSLIEEASAKIAAASNLGKNEKAEDLTLPGRKWKIGRKHPVNIVIDDCVRIFRRMGFIAAEGPEIETVFNNFDALNTPDDHPSRDPADTFYFADGRLLRTQTSPVQIRVMKKQEPPVRIVAPGRCFRRDTPDATHSANFHQIEGLYVDKDVSMADLKSALLQFARELMGQDVNIRLRPHFFPFTEPSVEYDFSCVMCSGKGCRICKHSGWLEISGAGMVNPAVLSNVGYDPEKWSGFAFGMGIERIAMIRYKINDIRLLYENDGRFLNQFLSVSN